MRQDLALFFLRITSGGMLLAFHGWGKLMNFSETVAKFPDPIGMGAHFSVVLVIFAEVVCAIAVIAGIFTRIATIPIIVFFLVALLIQHRADAWQTKEFVILYLIPFIAIFIGGGGKYSIDIRIGKRA